MVARGLDCHVPQSSLTADRRKAKPIPLAATHRAAIGIRSTLDRYEFPLVGTLPQRQLQYTVRAVIVSLAVGRRLFEDVKALAAKFGVRAGPRLEPTQAVINLCGRAGEIYHSIFLLQDRRETRFRLILFAGMNRACTGCHSDFRD